MHQGKFNAIDAIFKENNGISRAVHCYAVHRDGRAVCFSSLTTLYKTIGADAVGYSLQYIRAKFRAADFVITPTGLKIRKMPWLTPRHLRGVAY